MRAGIADNPETYRWCSLGYHEKTGNRGGFLSLDLGLKEFGVKGDEERLDAYRRFVYEKGGLNQAERQSERAFQSGAVNRFRQRTRYFTDSGIIGAKAFVSRLYQRFKGHFSSKHEKQPKTIQGLAGIYSLKRLSETLSAGKRRAPIP